VWMSRHKMRDSAQGGYRLFDLGDTRRRQRQRDVDVGYEARHKSFEKCRSSQPFIVRGETVNSPNDAPTMSLNPSDRSEKLERDPLTAQQLIFSPSYISDEFRPVDMKNVASLTREVLVPALDLDAGFANTLDQNVNVAILILIAVTREHDDAAYSPFLGHMLFVT
jgi:hypothetical protein